MCSLLLRQIGVIGFVRVYAPLPQQHNNKTVSSCEEEEEEEVSAAVALGHVQVVRHLLVRKTNHLELTPCGVAAGRFAAVPPTLLNTTAPLLALTALSFIVELSL